MNSLSLLLRVTAVSCILLAPSPPVSADVWVAADGTLAKVNSEGRILFTLDSVFGRSFSYCIGPNGIMGVDPRNGHVWVSDVNNDRLFELSAEGQPLREITALSPTFIGIDPNSGAVWTSILLNEVTFPRAVIKLDPNTGEELVRVTGFSRAVAAIVVARSGQVWIADRFNNEVVVLFGTNDELKGYDASAPTGPYHLRLGGFDQPLDIDIDPRNSSDGGGGAWVADRFHGEAVRILSDGTELVRQHPTGFFNINFVSVNSRDGSVWVADPNSSRLAKLSALGEEVLNRFVDFPNALTVDVEDDAVWLGTGFFAEARLRKLDGNGSELLSVSGLSSICGISAISTATVVIGGCDSGVPNALLPNGRTISDRVTDCAQAASNHGQFVQCVAHLANELATAAIISGQQQGALQRCAARAIRP